MDFDDSSDQFVRPPEAPVFTPTAAEFVNPVDFISKIRPTIEKTGICKIRPPQGWTPPFAVNVESFKFVPRVQKINELEATTRVKLIFLHKLFKFWELQGVVLRVPTVNRKPLDIHKLYKIVVEEGGYDKVTSGDKWTHIANTRMGLPVNASKCYPSVIKSHYEKILLPYDMFESRTRHAQSVPGESLTVKEEVGDSTNPEVTKPQFHTAGKNIAVSSGAKIEEKTTGGMGPPTLPRRAMRDRSKASYLESEICRICSKTDNESDILSCTNCDESYHRYCLVPRVSRILRGDWRCPQCVAKEYKKPTEVFGFEQSNTPYTLAEFGIAADKFKQSYFNKASVSYIDVEKEFWRLTRSINESVTVLYGADVHALTNGSGFPTEPNDDLSCEDEKYITSPWNLNNLAVNERSVLRYVSGDVSGMKVPWCYVGMCFSSFCWHIEDHWSYSINYNHWGEPKTWYGVPSSHAEQLEMVMKSRAPELFEQSPDLLHHITTMMNPNTLMANDIPVVRTDQCAGEFIVTAPRAFHAGFNQGYNFAEAVNFCPADWLPMGRASVHNYKQVKRFCVFSHEELICKMAADADNLDLTIAVETHKELLAIVDQERKSRKKLLEHGVKNAERKAFELLPDDERQCHYCKTTCFLSAITCKCEPDKTMCIEHALELCACPGDRKCLRYRYTLDEFPALIRNLGSRVEAYQKWVRDSRAAFNTTKLKDRVSFNVLRQLFLEAKEKDYPDNNLFRSLQRAVKDAEKYVGLVKEVVNRKARSRRHTDPAMRSAARRLSIADLKKLCSELAALACNIKDYGLVEELLKKGMQFQTDVHEALSLEPREREKLVKLHEVGLSLDLDLSEMGDLEQAVEQTKWIKDVEESMAVDEDDLITIDELIILVRRGHELPVHPDVDKVVTELEELLRLSQSWEEKASICLQASPKHTLSTIEAIITECKDVNVYMPNMESLKESVERSLEWKLKAEQALNPSHLHPTLDSLHSLVAKAKTLPIKLDLVNNVNSIIQKVDEWKSEAVSHFVRKESTDSLLDVLLPRQTSKPLTPRKKQQMKKASRQQRLLKNREKDNSSVMADRLLDSKFATENVYEKFASQEVESMKLERLSNQTADSSKLCHCGINPTGSMFQCDLCQRWLHYSCSDFSSNGPTSKSETIKILLCSNCARSNRPKLDVIHRILISLQKIPARFEEAEAVQYLTERVINWQQKALMLMEQTDYRQLNKKFSVIKAKNSFWKGKEAEQEEYEKHLETKPLPDHDYISPQNIPSKKTDYPVFDIPDVEPTKEFCQKLEMILVEGLLVEVTVPESEHLHSFYKTLSEYNLNGLQPPPPLKAKPPRKQVLSLRDENIKSASNSSVSINKPTQEAVISSTTSSHKETKSRRRKGDRKNSTGQKKKKRIVIEITEEEEDWGEYDENCAAVDGCLLPDEESISWVQCERCKQWFHFACIGMTPKELGNGDYFCVLCQPSDSDKGDLVIGELDSKSDGGLSIKTVDDPLKCSTEDGILVFPPLSNDAMS